MIVESTGISGSLIAKLIKGGSILKASLATLESHLVIVVVSFIGVIIFSTSSLHLVSHFLPHLLIGGFEDFNDRVVNLAVGKGQSAFAVLERPEFDEGFGPVRLHVCPQW